MKISIAVWAGSLTGLVAACESTDPTTTATAYGSTEPQVCAFRPPGPESKDSACVEASDRALRSCAGAATGLYGTLTMYGTVKHYRWPLTDPPQPCIGNGNAKISAVALDGTVSESEYRRGYFALPLAPGAYAVCFQWGSDFRPCQGVVVPSDALRRFDVSVNIGDGYSFDVTWPLESCAPRGYVAFDRQLEMLRTEAQALDETGAPLVGERFRFGEYNGPWNYAVSDAQGKIVWNESSIPKTVCDAYFFAFDSPLFYPYYADSPKPFVGAFPRLQPSGAAVIPGQTMSAAGITLSVPADAVTSRRDDGDIRFRAGKLITAAQVRAATGNEAFVALVTLAPSGMTFCPSAQLTLPNDAALPAGTPVELWEQTSVAGEFGYWKKAADAAVDVNGATITTVSGQGITVLGALAVKPLKPL